MFIKILIKTYPYKLFIKFLAFFIGTISTFILHEDLGISPVLASCLIGLVASFIPLNFYKEPHLIKACIYAGSFAGMCSGEVLTEFWEVLLVSLFGGILFFSLKNVFIGLGGKLGTIAFVSVALTQILKFLQ